MGPLETRPLTNVVRFPSERRARPTLELLRELAPNVPEVLAVVAAFGLPDPPAGVRARADAGAYHDFQVSGAGSPWALRSLHRLIDATVAQAIALCWSARDASSAVAEASRHLVQAQRTERGWLDQRRSRLETLRSRAADLLIEAHVAAERAEGVARAAGFAERGEPWVAMSADAGSVADVAAAIRASGYKVALRARASRKPPLVGAR